MIKALNVKIKQLIFLKKIEIAIMIIFFIWISFLIGHQFIRYNLFFNAPINCFKDTYNCSDMWTQADAQFMLMYCGSDVHHLDADHDGIACNSMLEKKN